MRLVLQRVASAVCRVDGEVVGKIGQGFLALVGVAAGDAPAEGERMAAKTAELRVFNDEQGRFERSLTDIGGGALVVSEFTLIADVRKGRRPSFNGAARPSDALPVYEAYGNALADLGVKVAYGRFGTHMDIELVNDGPVTIVIDSADLDRPRRQ
jgi:D-tyrosyl-tRNA(Tyr) deacylase